jgi:phospholipid/cholesterol/gamma-HCH transport system substrate-binding protein
MRLGRKQMAAARSLRQPLPVARLIAFALVGLLSLGYLLFNVVGAKTFEGNYRVKVELPATGGLFPGSQLTYRGVPIGIVSSIDITATGVQANLDIHDGVKVPRATLAVVADRSPAGEQYVDLQPTGSGPPYLQQDDTIPTSQTRLPPSLADLLGSVAAFSNSVNTTELRNVFNQLDIALAGTGPALGRIIDNTSELVTTLEAVEPQTIDLLNNGGKVLDTQAAHDGDLRTFSTSLRALADTLRSDDPKTVKLIGVALQTTQQVGPLLSEDAGNVGTLLTNLVTTGQIVDDRIPGLKALLVSLPRGLYALASAVHGDHVSFRLLTRTGAACAYKTRRQAPFIDHKGPPIVNAYCLHPTSKEQQRGAVYAPRPPGDDTAGPPSGSSASIAGTGSIRTTGAPQADSDSWLNVFAAGES